MRKVVLMLLAVVLSGNARAEWILVDSDGKADNYFNTENNHRVGGTITIEFLSDFAAPENARGTAPYSSIRSRYEFDCKRGLSRAVETYWYSGKMGTGGLIRSEKHDDQSGWHQPKAKTPESDYYFVACGQN